MSAKGFDLTTVGHSNLPVERFLELLAGAGVTALIDVRSVPASRRFPWFSAKALQARLNVGGIAYVHEGEALGGRPRDRALYRDGVADYEAMAATPEFQAGLARVMEASRHAQVCLMCAEREPLDCHRCLLVGRALKERGLSVGNILITGGIEPQATTEARLLALAGGADDLFADPKTRLAEAYRRRNRAVAAKRKPGG